MIRILTLGLALATLCAAFAAALAQTNPSHSAAPPSNSSVAPIDADRIARAMAQKETEFSKALNEYGYKRDAHIQTVAWGGQISGEYQRTSRLVLDERGNHSEKILFFPMPTLTDLQITPEYLDNLDATHAFPLETSNMGDYTFAYVGREKLDEVDTYIFDVTPKVISDSSRLETLKRANKEGGYFKGRVWVDDRDYQIVKTRGKRVPEFNQRFPTVETYREQIDGKYWFPTYTYADDELTFKDGRKIHLRMRIKFTEFAPLNGRPAGTER
jgi:hypothetical protein